MYNYPNSTVVTLDYGDDTTCSVNLHGCTITSWRLENWEQIYISRHAKFNHRKEIMGGISFDFPKYGGWKFGPPNGFACISKWNLLEAPHKLKNSRKVMAVFQLVDNAHTRSFWNFHFEMINTLILSERALEINTTITNTSPIMPILFNVMVPMFIQVPDIEELQIIGMRNVQYYDETSELSKDLRTDRKKTIQISDWTYRIYKEAPHIVELRHVTCDKNLQIENSGLDDFIVWNPWTDQGEYVEDFRPEQYKEMVCVGMGCVNKDIRLEPNETYSFSIKLGCDSGEELEEVY